MSAHARKSFVWLWMAALLSASFGMTVEQVYCYCTGKTTISLFASADTCDSEKQAAAQTGCCQKELTPAKKSCCEKPDSKKGNCTKKTTQIIQLRTEYEVASSVLKKLDPMPFFDLLPEQRSGVQAISRNEKYHTSTRLYRRI